MIGIGAGFFVARVRSWQANPLITTGQADEPLDADELRGIAEAILSDRAYARSEPGVLERLFDWLSGLFDFTPPSPELGGPQVGGFEFLRTGLIIVAVLLLVAWATSFVIRQRSAIRATERSMFGSTGRTSIAELERLASAAAQRGAYGDSLRLRFEAGLARLERKGTLSHPETRSSGEVAETLHLPEFDQVAETFDAVVYGGREAGAADATFAAQTWPAIVAQAPATDEDSL